MSTHTKEDPNFQVKDPYELIRLLSDKLKAQNQTVNWYKKMLETSEYEKKITMSQLQKRKEVSAKLQEQMAQEREKNRDYELQIEQMRNKLNNFDKINRSNLLKTSIFKNSSLKTSLFQSPSSRVLKTDMSTKLQRPLSTLSIELKKSQRYSTNSNSNSNPNNSNNNNVHHPIKILEEKDKNSCCDYIPKDIQLISKSQKIQPQSTTNNFNNSSAFNMSQSIDPMTQTFTTDDVSKNPKEFFVQDFLIVGPDLIEFKKLKNKDSRNNQTLTIKPSVIYNVQGKPPNETYTEISKRCFPYKINCKKLEVQNYQDIKQIIEYMPSENISVDHILINLRGPMDLSSCQNNNCEKMSNINNQMFVFCLKIPDFIFVRDEKNYQRKQQNVWIVEKVFCFVTFYPFFDILAKVLQKIHKNLFQERIEKIIIQKENYLNWGLSRNLDEFEKNQKVKSIISYFKNKKIDFGSVFDHKNQYYGSAPEMGSDCEYAICKLCAPFFMTNFSYEEMLLMLTAIFCQKSIVFLSQCDIKANLSAMFLISIMTPFPYTFPLILNSDEQKIVPYLYEYPFPIIGTIQTKSTNIKSLLSSYSSTLFDKRDIKEQADRLILVDVDSNSIFYQGQSAFQSLIISPSLELSQQYCKINPCPSKSFSFPQKMPIQNQQSFQKRHQLEKHVNELLQTIKNNQVKCPKFTSDQQIEKVLKMIASYVKSFIVDRDIEREVIMMKKTNPTAAEQYLKKCLSEKHPDKRELVEKIVTSQFYADYLDRLNEEA